MITATFTKGFETQYKSFELDVVAPTFGEPEYTWVWSDETQKYTVTAVKHCTNGGSWLDITEDVTAYGVEWLASTCSKEGYTKYRATFTKEGFETQERTDVVPVNENHTIQVLITGFDYHTHKGTAKVKCYACEKVLEEKA